MIAKKTVVLSVSLVAVLILANAFLSHSEQKSAPGPPDPARARAVPQTDPTPNAAHPNKISASPAAPSKTTSPASSKNSGPATGPKRPPSPAGAAWSDQEGQSYKIEFPV